MGKVTGLGGVFIKSADPKALSKWYEDNLGIAFNGNTYVDMPFTRDDGQPVTGSNVLSFSPTNSDYFAPSHTTVMINFRVENLEGLLKALKEKGVTLVGDPLNESYGKFAWLLDLDGNKIELWEPAS